MANCPIIVNVNWKLDESQIQQNSVIFHAGFIIGLVQFLPFARAKGLCSKNDILWLGNGDVVKTPSSS